VAAPLIDAFDAYDALAGTGKMQSQVIAVLRPLQRLGRERAWNAEGLNRTYVAARQRAVLALVNRGGSPP
jgi:hypothetical protein